MKEWVQCTTIEKLMAEAVGTGIIVLGGCGAVCASKFAGASFGQFGLAAAWGMSVALAAYSTRAISGGHLNPAVTLANVVTGQMAADEGCLFAIAQLLGATVAGAVNYAVFASAIAAMEQNASIVRGTAASTASFGGAFGMVPNAAVIGTFGAFVAEVLRAVYGLVYASHCDAVC